MKSTRNDPWNEGRAKYSKYDDPSYPSVQLDGLGKKAPKAEEGNQRLFEQTPTTKKPQRRDLLGQLSEAELELQTQQLDRKLRAKERRDYKTHLIGRLKMHSKLKKFLQSAEQHELFQHSSDQLYLINLVEKEDYENLSSALIHVLLVLLDKDAGAKPTAQGGSRGRMFSPEGLKRREEVSDDENRRSEINFLSDQGDRPSLEPEFHHEKEAAVPSQKAYYANDAEADSSDPPQTAAQPKNYNPLDRKLSRQSKNDSVQTRPLSRNDRIISPGQETTKKEEKAPASLPNTRPKAAAPQKQREEQRLEQ